MYLHRGVGPGGLPYIDRVIEYPVASGFLMYLAAVIAPGPLGVLLVTALASAALCVAITVVLERRFGRRAWRWALAVPVLLYAFQNWDVFAIAAMLAGLFAFERGRDGAAGAAFGLGAAVKLFPAIVVPPLIAVRLAAGDRRRRAPVGRVERGRLRCDQSSRARSQPVGVVVAVLVPGATERNVGERLVLPLPPHRPARARQRGCTTRECRLVARAWWPRWVG